MQTETTGCKSYVYSFQRQGIKCETDREAVEWAGREESLCPEASSLYLAVPPNHLSAGNTGLATAHDASKRK